MLSEDQAKALFGRRVRVRSGAYGDTTVMAEGKVIGYAPHPTIVLEHEDGTLSHWLVTLPIEELPPPDPISLMGDEDCGVSAMCRDHSDGGLPFAYYESGRPMPNHPYRDRPEVAYVNTIDDLLDAIDEHRKGHE